MAGIILAARPVFEQLLENDFRVLAELIRAVLSEAGRHNRMTKLSQPHRIWSLQEAESHFSEVLERALEDGPQAVVRHGREAEMIVLASQYKKMIQMIHSVKTTIRIRIP